jgi:prepilin-type processing-associated H-X9-DG protein
MKQLKVGVPAGDDDIQKLSNLLRTGVGGRPEMQRVYGNSINKEDGKGRSGLYIPVREIGTASGRLFLRELVLAAVSSNYLRLDGHVRVEIGEGGVLVYPVKSTSERWGS